MNSGSRWLIPAIAIAAIAGIVVSSVSLQHHYRASADSFCNLSETFNCDLVNQSIYSKFLGIPVALIGILGYATLLMLAAFFRRNPRTPKLLLLASIAGLSFALYLTYIEGFVLAVWCILCLTSLATISVIAILAAVLVFQMRAKVVSGKT